MRTRIFGGLIVLALLAGCGPAENATPTTVSGGVSTATPGALTPRPTVPVSTPIATAIPNPPTALPATAVPPTAPPATAPPATATTAPPAAQTITISEPAAGATVQSPLQVAGSASFLPFEANFGVAVYDSEGNILGQTGITGVGEYGSPSTFAGQIEFNAPASARPGKVVVFVASAKDGSIEVQSEVKVQLAGYAGGDTYIALPAENAIVTLPLHIEALNVGANSSSIARLTYDDGTVLEGDARTPSTTSSSVVANLAWATESAPPNPPSQRATLELVDRTGQVFATRHVYVLNQADEGVMPITLHFQLGDELREVTRYIPRTQAVATAALRELSWGPAGNETAAAGFTTLLPTPEKIASYPGRQADWGDRVYVQSVSIKDGVASVDWSKEMAAWGGGSAYLQQLSQQVALTLQQFPTITSVRMTVNGSEEVLQP
jgi:spore germination protein GerM